jgi:integrase
VNTKVGAAEYEVLLRLRLARGERIDAAIHEKPAETFSAFAERWFETYVTTNNKASEQHTKNVILRAHLLPWFGAKRLEAIGPGDIEQYKAAKLAANLSPKTVNNQLTVLSKCLRTAAEWGDLATVPRVRLLRARSVRLDFLSRAEAARLLAADAPNPWRLMVLIALRTGMRLGELVALDWADVDLEAGTVTVCRSRWRHVLDATKNYRARHIPIAADLRTLLLAQPSRAGLVLRSSVTGHHLSQKSATRALRRLCASAGVRPVGWHILRHTFASHLAAASVPVPAIRELLGHSTITTTMRYAHLAPSALRSAIEILEHPGGPPDLGQQVGTRPLVTPCTAQASFASDRANVAQPTQNAPLA